MSQSTRQQRETFPPKTAVVCWWGFFCSNYFKANFFWCVGIEMMQIGDLRSTCQIRSGELTCFLKAGGISSRNHPLGLALLQDRAGSGSAEQISPPKQVARVEPSRDSSPPANRSLNKPLWAGRNPSGLSHMSEPNVLPHKGLQAQAGQSTRLCNCSSSPSHAGASLEPAPLDHVPAGRAVLRLDQVGGRAGTCHGTSSLCPFPAPWGQSPACKVEMPPTGRAPG